MRAKKLTLAELETVRQKRAEVQLIWQRAKALRFRYVVNPPVTPKIAFGSSLHRVTLPIEGPNVSPFMRRNQGEVREYPGPSDYDTFKPLGFKYPSKSGFSAFANKVSRLPVERESGYPPLGAYDDNYKRTDRDGYTISGCGDRSHTPKWLTPGPSTYPIHTSYPSFKYSTCFGSKRIVWPAVAVFCSATNAAHCMKCDLTPIGDYFHNFTTNQDICRRCMFKHKAMIKQCSLHVIERYRYYREIQQFVPVRYCGFFHDHNGTNAAVELTSRKELRNKIRVENYLYRFHEKSVL